jgi:5-hydroxyisourate hydrolase
MTEDRSAVTTHVLDTMRGQPADGIPVLLQRHDGATVAASATDADGRAAALGPRRLDAGTYRLVLDTAAYFRSRGQEAFYPEVTVTFTLADPEQHYHVPVLLSPFAFSTYRGS